uniref:Uncharacterized protein n=1 Tax=Arundo donax TaxID=35708 RepID=A0A0A9G7P7_ARUDO
MGMQTVCPCNTGRGMWHRTTVARYAQVDGRGSDMEGRWEALVPGVVRSEC